MFGSNDSFSICENWKNKKKEKEKCGLFEDQNEHEGYRWKEQRMPNQVNQAQEEVKMRDNGKLE